jgi:hypothetical protein
MHLSGDSAVACGTYTGGLITAVGGIGWGGKIRGLEIVVAEGGSDCGVAENTTETIVLFAVVWGWLNGS